MKSACLFLLLLLYSNCFSQTLKINITGLRNNSGTVRMGFYTTDEAFDKETPLFIKVEPKAATKNGILSLTYTGMKPGVYGIALLDDENNNDKVDYGWILPKEGFGFSNYYHTGMTKPHLEKFSFTITEGQKIVEIKVKYL